MIKEIRLNNFTFWATVLLISMCFIHCASALCGEIPSAPQMPAHWTVVSDFPVPAEQVKAISSRLGTNLRGVRNTVYDVNGKRVQINVIVTLNSDSAKKLMVTLKSMKIEESLLQKERIVYEFVGKNDVLDLIAEGRKHLNTN